MTLPRPERCTQEQHKPDHVVHSQGYCFKPEPRMAEQWVNKLESFLDKIPWTAFSHGAMVSAFQKAIDEAREEGKRDSIIEFCEGDRSLLAEYEAKAYEQGRAEGIAEEKSSHCMDVMIPLDKFDELMELTKSDCMDEALKYIKTTYAQGFSDTRERAAKVAFESCENTQGKRICTCARKIRALQPSLPTGQAGEK